MQGLYLHIPFCKSRCIYCAFYSTTLSELLQDRYVQALKTEMLLRGSADISTIYLGGGTPSLLSEGNLSLLFQTIYSNYNVDGNAEVTMECNPDDVTPAFAKSLHSLPVNRVSLGAQTFNNDRLRFLHRRHSAEQVFRAVDLLRNAGFGNISLDLMFGFPQETLADWERDIETLLTIKPEHVSAYSLMYEEGTILKKMRDERLETSDEEELSRKMYELLMDKLANAGYEHYEISNWAQTDDKGNLLCSRHNNSYWKAVPYIGIGAAAHSFDMRTRSWNISDIHSYIENIENGNRPFDSETIDDVTRYNDLITTALRTREGIDTETLDEPFKNYLIKNAEKHICNHTLKLSESHLSLTRDGLFISDDIMSDLIYV